MERTPTILIVDDEPNVYHGLRRTLHRENYRLLQAADAPGAEEVLDAEDVDIAIVDMNMPGMTGDQLLARIRQRWPDVVRMMLTGNACLDLLAKAVNVGEVYRFFLKPVDDAELIVSLRDALQMKALKEESRHLLEAVRKQRHVIGRLKSNADAVIQLDDFRPPPDAISLGGDASGKHPPRGGDLDTLLADVRAELSRLGC